MSPQLFEIDKTRGRLLITPNAYMIADVKDVIDKYKDNAEPYLAYCHLMSAIDSPLRNLSDEEKRESAIIEVYSTIGEFDSDDPILDRCIERLKSLYTTPIYRLFELAEQEIHNMIYYLSTTPMSSEDLGQRKSILQDLGKIAASVSATKKTVLEDLKQNTRGDQEVGQIR